MADCHHWLIGRITQNVTIITEDDVSPLIMEMAVGKRHSRTIQPSGQQNELLRPQTSSDVLILGHPNSLIIVRLITKEKCNQ